ncbi:uncharacterized protein LOC127881548 isoform X1 [Dreissena polymorpha]|uniref:Uncharacterized protein n=1 Tax=Dreissena polymorpha TaxID=45954 RepID=A0A9D4H0I8_DREPO|nr:uncharacterized protein LOC127881548 isoform X1 [Dreissena polymorpha]KAH3826227.1 hypothetical protein DPMN_128123 [Dreissena polymorpha]
MWINKLVCVFILAAVTVNAESYYESESDTIWRDVTCKLGEPQLSYNNGLFEVNETWSSTGDVWIGYLYAKVPFLLLGCARLQSVNGVYVNKTSDCFTICKGGTFGIQRTRQAPLGLLCICGTGSLDTSESSCIGGDKTSLCNKCFEIYTQINVNASHASGPNDNPGDDCLTYFHPHFKWQPCSGESCINSMCSNASYPDFTATATTTDVANNEWAAGNKLCLATGRHPSFVQSIIKTGFTDAQTQYHWTGIFRDNILIKLSLKDAFSRFSNDGYVYVHKWSKVLHSSNHDETKRALCVKGAESTTRHPETSNHTTEIIPSITQSIYADTSAILTTVTTPGFTISLQTTQMHTPIATDYAFPTSNDGRNEESGHPHSEKSSAISIGIGVSVGILLLVGGAVVIFLHKRRRIFNCNRTTGKNKPLQHETELKENMTYGKNIEDNVAQQNYFILEKCEQSISTTADHYSVSNEANMEDDYNTIHETEEPYEHVKDESNDYDHTTSVLPSGSHARKPENVYNKLKIDRPGHNVHGQNHGHNVVQSSEDDYNTTSAVMSFGKDDVSDYNHISHTAYKEATTNDDITGDTGGDYDAINSKNLKVAQSDSSDHAHVNKDRIK